MNMDTVVDMDLDLDMEMIEMPTTPSASMEVDDYVLALSTVAPSPIPPAPPSIASLATLKISDDPSSSLVQGPAASVPNSSPTAVHDTTQGQYPDFATRDMVVDDCDMALSEMTKILCAFKNAPRTDWWVTHQTVRIMLAEWEKLTKSAKRTAWNQKRKYDTAQNGLCALQKDEGRARRHVKKTHAMVIYHGQQAATALKQWEQGKTAYNQMSRRAPQRKRDAQGLLAWRLRQALDRQTASTKGLHQSYHGALTQYMAASALTRSYRERHDISAALRRSTAATQKSREAREGLQRLKTLSTDLHNWAEMKLEVPDTAHSLHMSFHDAQELPAKQALPALQFLHKRVLEWTAQLTRMLTTMRDNAAAVQPMQECLQRQTAQREHLIRRSRRDSALVRARQALMAPDPYDVPSPSNDVRRRRPPSTSALQLVDDDAKDSELRPRPFVTPRRRYPVTQPPSRAPFIEDNGNQPVVSGAHSQSVPIGFRPASQYHAAAQQPPAARWTMDYGAGLAHTGCRLLPVGFLADPGAGAIDVKHMMPTLMDAVLAPNDPANNQGPISWIQERTGFIVGTAYNDGAAHPGNGQRIPHWELFELWQGAISERELQGWTLNPAFDLGVAFKTRATVFSFVEISVILPRFNKKGYVTSWWGAVMSRNHQGQYVRTHVMLPFRCLKGDVRLPAPPNWPRCTCSQVPYCRFVMDPGCGPLGVLCHIGVRMTKNARCGVQFEALEVVTARVIRGGGWMVPTCGCTEQAWGEFGDWYCNRYNTTPGQPTLPHGLQYAFLDGQGGADQFQRSFWANNPLI